MRLTPDQAVIFHYGHIAINETIALTWAIMVILVILSRVITLKLTSRANMSRGQNMLELIIIFVQNQIKESGIPHPERYLPFIGTLFIFIGTASVLSIIPWFEPPTGSLSTTAALAVCVFIAVPLFGILEEGVAGYLKHYVQPSIFMLPFHLMGEISRTLALAVRLFGNMMSETKLIAILLAVSPFFFPVIMHALGLVIGLIQAYIFAVLALVYIASASLAHEERKNRTAAK